MAWMLFAAITALSAPAEAEGVPRIVPISPDSTISAQLDRFIGAFEACDARTLSSLFTPEGVYAANTGQVLVGRDEIRNGVQGWMTGPLKPACQSDGTALNVERRKVRLDVLDGVAYSLTRFVIRIEPMQCAIDAGHILGVWRRQPSGQWLLEALAGNKDPAQPPNACPS